MQYQRILLKLSGEALGQHADYSKNKANTSNCNALNTTVLLNIVKEIAHVVQQKVQMGIVVGGGNWFRGPLGELMGFDRVTSDHMGMLATVMNALVLRDKLMQQSVKVRIMSAIPIAGLVEPFDVLQARKSLEAGYIVIFSAGIGHPFVSTDVAASLRALEIKADILLKATTVDGIYSADPLYNPEAVRYNTLSYTEVLQKELKVMDLAAFIQCRDYKLPIQVFNIHTPSSLLKVVQGASIGTLVH